MRWNETAPPMMMNTDQHQDQESLPQRELDDSDESFEILRASSAGTNLRTAGTSCRRRRFCRRAQALQNLRFAVFALADFHGAAAELIRAARDVNERLIFVVTQHGRVGHGDGVLHRRRQSPRP